ncbi:hypothetical protein DFJ73DRAFT_19412 [Zopfochytrium polystomum]|nr:hypothetical protein DFJ73DRAFT_19412 [Zopfochytrium polystomum]
MVKHGALLLGFALPFCLETLVVLTWPLLHPAPPTPPTRLPAPSASNKRQYTVRSASNSISNLSSNIQERIANEISSAIVSTSVIVTQTALYQRELFQAGRWSLTPDRRAATVRSMLAVLNQFNRWSVNLFAMTVPAGELNGWGIWPNQPPSTIMNTVQTNFTRITYLCDLKGTPISVVQNFTDPGDGSVAFPGNNATLSFIAGGLVNFSDPNFHTLSPSSPFLGGTFLKTDTAAEISPFSPPTQQFYC